MRNIHVDTITCKCKLTQNVNIHALHHRTMQHYVISFSDAIEFKMRSSRLRITKIPYKNENYRIVRIFIFHSSFTLRWSLHRHSGRKIKQQTKAYWQHKLPSIWQIKPYVYEIVEIYFYLLFRFLDRYKRRFSSFTV